MASEIMLISEIEKRPCLYNYTLTDYNRKEVYGEAWNEIAVACQMTAQECKDKWKNIRSSYGRNLRRGSMKPGKPYYLSNYLQFLTPFLKAYDFSNELESVDNNNTSDSEQIFTTVKADPLDIPLEMDIHAGESSYGTNENAIEMTVSQSNVLTLNPGVPTQRKKRKIKYVSAMTAKKKKISPNYHVIAPPASVRNADDNPMRMFMLSLLPEFNSMTESQIRLFKIKVMMLIDDIKTRSDEVKKNLQSDNEANLKLQKKLINLLIRHLPGAEGTSE